MSAHDSAPLAAQEQREVAFYDDRVVAVLIPSGTDEPAVFVPIRPICDQLGLSWPAQFERIKRDPVLSEVSQGVRVTRTPAQGGEQEMLCLPIEYLNGWLFGISASRIRAELRDKVIRYQRECYLVLWEAFRPELLGTVAGRTSVETASDDLYHIRLGVDGILDYLWRRHQHDEVMRRLLEMTRLDVHEVGGLVEDGSALTARQRQTIYQLALELVALLGQLAEITNDTQNPFPLVFGGLKKRFGVSTYREIARDQYRNAHEYLTHWKADVQQHIRGLGEEPIVL